MMKSKKKYNKDKFNFHIIVQIHLKTLIRIIKLKIIRSKKSKIKINNKKQIKFFK